MEQRGRLTPCAQEPGARAGGKYRVKHEGLIPLHQKALRLAAQIGHVTFEHVRRELNQEADHLSNLGMDMNR